MLAEWRKVVIVGGICLPGLAICAQLAAKEPLVPARPMLVEEVPEAVLEQPTPPVAPELGPVPVPEELPSEEPATEPEKLEETQSEELPPSDPTPAKQPQPPLPKEVPLTQVTTLIAPPTGALPADAAAKWSEEGAKGGYYFAEVGVMYFWDAPNLCYRPLYFEEPNLERLGYSRTPIVQPATSGIHFFASTLALPYQMTVHRPRECMAPLGHYRPGSPVPYRRIYPEWDAKAAAVQAAAVTGLIFIIP